MDKDGAMKPIARIEFIDLNKMDYVIGMLKQIRHKAAKMYEPNDIQLLFKRTGRHATTVIFYLMEPKSEKNNHSRK